MARPRKNETLIQTSFRLYESELTLIKEAAAEMDISTSAFIRMSALKITRLNLSGYLTTGWEND